MCIFCKGETTKNEFEKHYIEQCGKCNGKIVLLKNNDKIIVSKFPKHDKIRNILLFLPLFLIGTILITIFFGRVYKNIEANFIIKEFLIEIIIFVALIIFSNIINLINYKRKGYMYYGLNNVVTTEGKKSTIILSKIYSYFVLFFGIQFIIIMSIMIYKKMI
jgi:hypothetical protein